MQPRKSLAACSSEVHRSSAVHDDLVKTLETGRRDSLSSSLEMGRRCSLTNETGRRCSVTDEMVRRDSLSNTLEVARRDSLSNTLAMARRDSLSRTAEMGRRGSLTDEMGRRGSLTDEMGRLDNISKTPESGQKKILCKALETTRQDRANLGNKSEITRRHSSSFGKTSETRQRPTRKMSACATWDCNTGGCNDQEETAMEKVRRELHLTLAMIRLSDPAVTELRRSLAELRLTKVKMDVEVVATSRKISDVSQQKKKLEAKLAHNKVKLGQLKKENAALRWKMRTLSSKQKTQVVADNESPCNYDKKSVRTVKFAPDVKPSRNAT